MTGQRKRRAAGVTHEALPPPPEPLAGTLTPPLLLALPTTEADPGYWVTSASAAPFSLCARQHAILRIGTPRDTMCGPSRLQHQGLSAR